MASNTSTDIPNETSAAQELLKLHNDHNVTVEEVPDEDLPLPAPSSKAAGKQKASEAPAAMNEDNFPALGGPKKAAGGAAPTWGGKMNGANGAGGGARTVPASGSPAVSGAPRNAAPSLSIPNRNVESITLEPQHVLARNALKRPIPDIIKDINRKSRANVNYVQQAGGRYRFDATGPQDAAQQALKDVVQQIGTKLSIKVSIPASAKAHVIGKGGSTVKALQEKTGARIQMPRNDEVAQALEDDEDAMIDVVVEGNALSAAAARQEIMKIAGERTANANIRLRDIPAEFYPFIADSKANFISDLESRGVQVRVPAHQVWSAQPPVPGADGQRPVFTPADDNHIHLAGERSAVQNARSDIEQLVEELRGKLAIDQCPISKGRHRFIIGDLGTPAEDFFNETGCAIILPTDEDDDTVTIVGPSDQLEIGLNKAVELATQMQCSNMNIATFHRQAAGGATAHARNVTRYLRQRKEIERLEKHYSMHITTPMANDGLSQWELYGRDGKSAIQAQKEIKAIITSHPPARVTQVPVDPFFHTHFRQEVQPRIRQDYGVFLVVPEASEADAPVLLVYEGPSEPDTSYRVPQAQPSAADLKTFEKSIAEARKHLLDLVGKQESIVSQAMDIPQKFHPKLKRFIKQEQEKRPSNQIPIRVSSLGTTVTLKGPVSAVESLAAKIEAFIEQEKEDEKERGFTLSFEFPQKFAHHLIGKQGRNIVELREKFDVEIQVQDGEVELKGPKAKAEVAKSHILSLARQWADEATHTLKIEPKFHRELIGAKGDQINRLQTRYKVLIFFPRSGKSTKDEEGAADTGSDAGSKPRRQQGPDEVIIRGPKKGADEARDEILTLYQYLKDHSFTATLSVQQKQLPTLIGQGGSAMEALRQETGAKIDIPNDRDSPDTMVEIQIKGTKSEVAAAKKILEEKKAIFDDTVVKTIEVDKVYHKALIGAGGSNLRDLVVKAGGSDDRRELSRTIQFPKQESDGNTIKLEGRKSVIEKLVTQIEEFVKTRESQVTETIEVAVEKHRSLIGRGGDVKKQMESQFGVSIDIPRQGSGQTGVKIAGQPENVEKAKAHIASLTKEQPTETIQVPRSQHHAISNGGQIFSRIRRENHVTIDHAGQAVPARPSPATNSARKNGGALPLITDENAASSDAVSWNVVDTSSSGEEGDIPWVLHGTPENIEKAKKVIENALEKSSKGGVTGYLALADPRTYRHVVGREGKTINSIRKQSGCQINVPNAKNDDGAIEISGPKDGVEMAKELILAAVRDGAQPRE